MVASLVFLIRWRTQGQPLRSTCQGLKCDFFGKLQRILCIVDGMQTRLCDCEGNGQPSGQSLYACVSRLSVSSDVRSPRRNLGICFDLIELADHRQAFRAFGRLSERQRMWISLLLSPKTFGCLQWIAPRVKLIADHGFPSIFLASIMCTLRA